MPTMAVQGPCQGRHHQVQVVQHYVYRCAGGRARGSRPPPRPPRPFRATAARGAEPYMHVHGALA